MKVFFKMWAGRKQKYGAKYLILNEFSGAHWHGPCSLDA